MKRISMGILATGLVLASIVAAGKAVDWMEPVSDENYRGGN